MRVGSAARTGMAAAFATGSFFLIKKEKSPTSILSAVAPAAPVRLSMTVARRRRARPAHT
jgi:hypothetical protein